MAGYILRNVDPELWEQFKARAASEGHALRWILLALIRRYIERGFD